MLYWLGGENPICLSCSCICTILARLALCSLLSECSLLYSQASLIALSMPAALHTLPSACPPCFSMVGPCTLCLPSAFSPPLCLLLSECSNPAALESIPSALIAACSLFSARCSLFPVF
jgi:hypothetical protein